jgi:putative oxidoreductase
MMLGFLGRIAALGIMAVMAGAVALVHAPFGFFMNWAGTNRGEGYEFHLLAIGIALAIFVSGSGPLSLDNALSRRLALRKLRVHRERSAA